MIPIPEHKYKIILADPPWDYKDKANAGKRGASHKYQCMSLEEVMLLRRDIDLIVDKDCLLALWWVGPMPELAQSVVAAWGFTFKNATGFSWVKLTSKGNPAFGMGHLTRGNVENCLFAVRGHPKRVNAGVSQLIMAQAREHSRKPDEVHDRLVKMMGDVPRIELFARTRREGWDAWGDELSMLG